MISSEHYLKRIWSHFI